MRGQKKQKASGSPREERKRESRERLVYILLTHSNSLDPCIILWGTPPHFPTLNPPILLPKAFIRPEYELHQQQKKKIKQQTLIILLSPQYTHHMYTPERERERESAGCFLLFKWVSVSGARLHFRQTYLQRAIFWDNISLTSEASKNISLRHVHNELHFWDKDTFSTHSVSILWTQERIWQEKKEK